MAYSDFSYPEICTQFGLEERTEPDLFSNVPPREASPHLLQALKQNSGIATVINTEKARSEYLIAPVLGEIAAGYFGRIGLYSGVEFVGDLSVGLAGYCDFLFCRSIQRHKPSYPAVIIIEAKREDLNAGMGQCIAGMLGAQRFNRKAAHREQRITGCVTSGTAWRFLTLDGNALNVGLREYLLSEVSSIIGILTSLLGPVPVAEPLAA